MRADQSIAKPDIKLTHLQQHPAQPTFASPAELCSVPLNTEEMSSLSVITSCESECWTWLSGLVHQEVSPEHRRVQFYIFSWLHHQADLSIARQWSWCSGIISDYYTNCGTMWGLLEDHQVSLSVESLDLVDRWNSLTNTDYCIRAHKRQAHIKTSSKKLKHFYCLYITVIWYRIKLVTTFYKIPLSTGSPPFPQLLETYAGGGADTFSMKLNFRNVLSLLLLVWCTKFVVVSELSLS